LLSLLAARYRAAAPWRRPAWAKVSEVGAVAGLTMLVWCLLPLVGQCREAPDDDGHGGDGGSGGGGSDYGATAHGADDGGSHRRLSGAGALRFVQYGCGDHEYNSIASLSLVKKGIHLFLPLHLFPSWHVLSAR